MTIDAKVESQILTSPGHPQAQEWIYLAGKEALKPAGSSFEDPGVPGEALAELIRRALLELSRRTTPGSLMTIAARFSISCSIRTGRSHPPLANRLTSACG